MQKVLEILKLKLFWYYFSAFLVITLFTICAFFDLQISQSIVNVESEFGCFMENFGLLGSPVLCMFAGIFASVYNKKHAAIYKRHTKLILWRLCVIVCFAISSCILYICNYPPNYIVVLFILIPITYYVASNIALAKLKYIFKLSVLMIFYIVTLLLIVQALKLVWGRVRFYDLEDVAQFSPWYVIQGVNGHRSFPSGHTANAMGMFILTSLNYIYKNKYFRVINLTFVSVWIILMAYSRVLVGAHYCSDVLFSIVFGLIWFYISKYFVAKGFVKGRQRYIDNAKQDNVKSTIITKVGEEI